MADPPDLLKRILAEKLTDGVSRPLPSLTPRRLRGAVSLPGKATAVIGIRRGGKTTFLHQLRGESERSGTPREHLPYINFEDERLSDLEASHLGYLVEEHCRQFPSAREADNVVWCFDEIQVVPGWEKFVRRLLDTRRDRVLVTGSSAALLSREIASALRGRAWEVLLHPFSFREALEHHGIEEPKAPNALSSSERTRVEVAFQNWLVVGGFPEAQRLDTASRNQLLRDYVDVAMLRDVVERHGVTNIVGLRWLVRHLLSNAACSFSVQKFFGALKSQGVAVSKDTVHQLLSHLEDCFLVRIVSLETTSERQRMVNPRKAYPVDTGLIPVFDHSERSNIGHVLETAVLIELERRRSSVTYLKTADGHEVDFLVRKADGSMELIQVCADASDATTARRELRALVEARSLYPSAVPRLLTLNRDGAPSELPPGVVAQPAYEWMLSEDS